MSSEALERERLIIERLMGRLPELPRREREAVEAGAALLAEVARLEQARDTIAQEAIEMQSRPTWELLNEAQAALAVAREREQRATEGLGRAYRDSETAERCVIARLCDDYLDCSGALLGRVRAAALVDEPAADDAPFSLIPRPSAAADEGAPEETWFNKTSAAADEPEETP